MAAGGGLPARFQPGDRLVSGQLDAVDLVGVLDQDDVLGCLPSRALDLFVAGDIDMMINWQITAYDERLGVLFTPYMVTSWDEAFEAYKPGGWVNDMLVGIYDDLGLKFFGPWPEGFNGIASAAGLAKMTTSSSFRRNTASLR